MQLNETSGNSQQLQSKNDEARVAGGPNGNGGSARTAWLLGALGVGTVVATVCLRESARTRGTHARTFGLAGAAVAGATLVEAVVLVRRRTNTAKHRAIAVKASVTIRRSQDELYRYWRAFQNLPTFMRHVDSVTELDGHSVWHAHGPRGFSAEWEAEIVGDRPGERIAWRSLEGATIPNHGSVEFRPAPRGRGTEVHLEIAFEPPGGALGAGIARLFGVVPEESVKNDLRRLKQLLETGEIVHSDASIHRGMHPARPPRFDETPLLNGMVRS